VQYALLAGPLLSMLDSSIVNVAVEPIARELRASLTVVQWTVSGYLLALGAGLAGTAFLARRFGTLPVYRASVIAFTVASALCALAPARGCWSARGSCRAGRRAAGAAGHEHAAGSRHPGRQGHLAGGGHLAVPRPGAGPDRSAAR
jgi:MFS family permease